MTPICSLAMWQSTKYDSGCALMLKNLTPKDKCFQPALRADVNCAGALCDSSTDVIFRGLNGVGVTIMHYKDVLPITRQEAELAFSSGNVPQICDVLVRVTYHGPDWEWVQAQCLHFGKHPHPEIRGLAATCIGHLARIHGVLNTEVVCPLLEELLEDPEISGRAQDALDDIKVYLWHR